MGAVKTTWAYAARIAGFITVVATVAVSGVAAPAALALTSSPAGVPAGRTLAAGTTAGADTLRKGPPWCLATVQSRNSQSILERIQQFADAPADDSALVEVRIAAGDMPRTPIAQIETVTNEATCRKASQALDKWYWATPQGAAVHLVKVGTRYAIHAPGVSRGEFEEMIHTDSKFAKLAIILF